MRQVLRSVPRVPLSALDEITRRDTDESMARRREAAARCPAAHVEEATAKGQRTGFEGERDFCGACFGILGAASFGIAVWALVAWMVL